MSICNFRCHYCYIAQRPVHFQGIQPEMEYTPVYPVLYAQITRKLRALDIYIGAENITGYRQHNAIMASVSRTDMVFKRMFVHL